MYPEHEKINTEALQTIDNLAEWLQEQGYSICKLNKLAYYEGEIQHANWRDLRAKFFGTSENALEEERQQMLKNLQKNG